MTANPEMITGTLARGGRHAVQEITGQHRYDVTAADGQRLGTDVAPAVARILVACCDGGPPFVCVHQPEAWETDRTIRI